MVIHEYWNDILNKQTKRRSKGDKVGEIETGANP